MLETTDGAAEGAPNERASTELGRPKPRQMPRLRTSA